MMLTKKGSTRGTVSVLFLSALIFLVARFAVNTIESAMPVNSKKTIAWKTVPDVLKHDRNLAWVKTEDNNSTPDIDAKSNETNTLTSNSDEQSDYSNAKLSEAKKILDSASRAHSNPTKNSSSATPAKVKNKSKKRFALEKIFPDNVAQLPVLLFFTDDSSTISQKMEKSSLGVKEIREKIEKEYYPVKISFDQKLSITEYQLYQEYGSTAVPLVNVLTSTGESLAYNSGYISAVKVMVLLHNAQRKQSELDKRRD